MSAVLLEKFRLDGRPGDEVRRHLEHYYFPLQQDDIGALLHNLRAWRRRVRESQQVAPPTHSPDFTSVDWFGTRYTFTKGNQAEAVRVLWDAWASGGHSLSQETIGERISSTADRFELAKVFRRRAAGGGYEPHPAWGTMIRSDSKGSYRLAPPGSA